MPMLLISFLGGVLTVAAPCVLPLLPVILGRTVSTDSEAKGSLSRPLVIAGSLAISVILFTLLLKATTSLLGVPQIVWQLISGIILIVLGTAYVVPSIWERVSQRLALQGRTTGLLQQSTHKSGVWGDVATGAALGPVFNSCSPTYALIVATVLPVTFAAGLVYLTSYALGMALTLLAISLLGRSFVHKLGWLHTAWFQKLIGALFILVGLAIIIGLDKDIQTYVLEQGWYAPVENIEHWLRR